MSCPRNCARGALPNDKKAAAGPGREGLGRSRGGLTTKIHLAADARCRPLARILTPGQHGDCPQFIPLMGQVRIARPGTGRPRTRPGAALGDKAYSSAANRAYLRRRGITAVIPVKEDQKNNRRARGRRGGRPPAFGATRYRDRNTVERCFPSSSSSAPSPPSTTNARRSTRAPSMSPRSGSGYETHHMIYKTGPSSLRVPPLNAAHEYAVQCISMLVGDALNSAGSASLSRARREAAGLATGWSTRR
jgi:hypothetical protein